MSSAAKESLLAGKKRRSRTEIIAIIITLAEDGKSKTEIAKKAHFNSKHLQLYLNKLTKLGLIELKNPKRRKIYITSERGIQYLKQYNTIKKTLVELNIP